MCVYLNKDPADLVREYMVSIIIQVIETTYSQLVRYQYGSDLEFKKKIVISKWVNFGSILICTNTQTQYMEERL